MQFKLPKHSSKPGRGCVFDNSSAGDRSLFEIPENLMPGAEPIFIDQGEIGLLFFHGFTGSPYEGRDLAAYFSERGYGVWVPLLPGHGTRPQDLEGLSYSRWLESATRYYFAMRERYQRVIVSGQSMGGAIALHLTANYPVDMVITLAAAVFLKDWRLKLLPIARKFIRYQFKSKGPDIRNKEAKSKSASYGKYPISSLEEFLALIRLVRSELPKVTAPALLVHSRRDHTITYENLAYISSHIASPVKESITVANSNHVISVDNDKDFIFHKMEKFIKRQLGA